MYQINFGNYKGQTLERLFFDHPDYLGFAMTAQKVFGGLRDLLLETGKLIAVVDLKPIVCGCSSPDCGGRVIAACLELNPARLLTLCPGCLARRDATGLHRLVTSETIFRCTQAMPKLSGEAAREGLLFFFNDTATTEIYTDEDLETFFRRTPPEPTPQSTRESPEDSTPESTPNATLMEPMLTLNGTTNHN